MKYIQKSASKIIRVGKGIFLHAIVDGGEECIARKEIMEAFGKIPPRDYKVTYIIRKTGKYSVEYSRHPCLLTPGKHNGLMAICWLPNGWDGKKVNRIVKLLPKRRLYE